MNDITFVVNTHLGEFLNHNDTVLGYDLDAMVLPELQDETDRKLNVPPVVLVKKTYPKFRKKQKQRVWKLNHMEKEEEDNNIHHKKNQGAAKKDREYEMFL